MSTLCRSMIGSVMAGAALLIIPIEAHIYEIYPPSRQILSAPVYDASGEDCPFYGKGTSDCPAFMNAKGPESVRARAIANTDPGVLEEFGNGEWPLKWVPKAENGNYLEPDEIAKRHGICGDPNVGALDTDNWYGTASEEWVTLERVEEGQVLEIKMGMYVYHKGHVEFMICNTDESADPDGVPTQECFNMHPLSRAVDDGDASPIDPQYPGRYYVDPECRASETDQSKPAYAMAEAYVITARYQLPPDLVCDHCILQMVYYTGNDCKHEGYDDFNPTSWPAGCASEKENWIDTDLPPCGEAGAYPEEFWGCSDINIVPYGTTPSPAATTETCDGALDQSDCAEGAQLYVGQPCDVCDVNECCGEVSGCGYFDFECPTEVSVFTDCAECTAALCCETVTCQEATFDATAGCLSGTIDNPQQECVLCDASECCDVVMASCEVLNFDSGVSTEVSSVLKLDDCVFEGVSEYEVTIPRGVIGAATEAYASYVGCFDLWFSIYDSLTSAEMTQAACLDLCNRTPIQFFRLSNDGEGGTICQCVAWYDDTNTLTPTDEAFCDIPCAGDADVPCGGFSTGDNEGWALFEIFNVDYTWDIFDEDGNSLTGDAGLPWPETEGSGFVVSGVTPGTPHTIVVYGADNNGGQRACHEAVAFTPACPCEDNSDCDMYAGEICCPNKNVCEVPLEGTDPSACGDPHMTGFLGQKFDFTGADGEWYCLIKDQGLQVSMRVTAPVPSLPEITYITGLSVVTADAEGTEHDIVIEVKDPHSLDSACPHGVSPCLAEGSLRVVLDGEEMLQAPGSFQLGPDVVVSAVNLPGACRSFGFDTYWERKKMDYASSVRRLSYSEQDMGEWILGDPTATNIMECMEYVARASTEAGALFAHESEHATFQIWTRDTTIRLTHGRLHQVAMRDPTDQYDLPDHVTWQMNVGFDHNDISKSATGILGETFVPTLDASGHPIMFGMESIRGKEEDYLLEGPREVIFAQDTKTS